MILRLVENVPEKWEKRRFQEVAKIGNGQVDPTEKTYEDWLYLGPENVSSNNGKISTLKSVRQLGLISGKYFFDENSIVYAKINPYLNKVCIPGFQGLCSADMYPIWKKGKIDKRYLHQYMLSSLFLRQSISVSTRTGMPKINRNELNKIWILVPPLSEQEKIAEILGRWDRAMELVSEKIDAKEQLKTGLMQQLLTGKVRFQGFGEDWKEISLGQFLKMKLRKVEKPGTAYLRLGVRSHGKGTFITIVDDPSKVNMTHLYQVREGDLIVSITFAWEGAIAMVEVDGDFAHVSHRFPTYKIDTKKVVPEFFRYLMHTPRFFYDLGVVSPGGAGRNRVMSKRNFLKIKVKVPSVEEQKKIGNTLMVLDKEIKLLVSKLETLEDEKRGLMQKLLTGEVRVRV